MPHYYEACFQPSGPLVSPMYVCQHLAPDLTFGPEVLRRHIALSGGKKKPGIECKAIYYTVTEHIRVWCPVSRGYGGVELRGVE